MELTRQADPRPKEQTYVCRSRRANPLPVRTLAKAFTKLYQPCSNQFGTPTPATTWTLDCTVQHAVGSNGLRRQPLLPRPFHQQLWGLSVAVYFPCTIELTLLGSLSAKYYENPPDWYSATVPSLATPTDLQGDKIFTTSAATTDYAALPVPGTSFKEWTAQLPPAEKRMVTSVYVEMCDAEHLLTQYMQTLCTLYIGTDGGKRHHSGSFARIICSPGKEHLCLNAGPVDGWFKCQSSLRSEAAALASATLYLNELATWAAIDIKCRFKIFVDSTSAISNVNILKEHIPKRRYTDNANILSVMRSADHVITRFTLAGTRKEPPGRNNRLRRSTVQRQTQRTLQSWPPPKCKGKAKMSGKQLDLVYLPPGISPSKCHTGAKSFRRTTSNASAKKSASNATARFSNRNTSGRTKFGPPSRGMPLHTVPAALRSTNVSIGPSSSTIG